jgi:ferredoxin-NADP reductase
MRVIFDHSEPVAHNIISFYFKPPRKVRYTAGQFIELTLPHDNPDKRGHKHWFTVSASPSEDLLAITTKFPGEGQTSTFKQTLQKLKPGEEVLMSDPMGDFVLPKDKTIPIVFVAGGIGVTPMRSMVNWLVDEKEQRPIKLIYAANSQDEVAFADLFKVYGLPVAYVFTKPPKNWKGESGRLDAKRILELAPDKDNQLYYLSGPEPMVEAFVKDLAAAGIPSRRLVGDYFPNYTNSV